MRPSQRNRPDDPFVPGLAMLFRVAVARVRWRWPGAVPAVTAVLIAAAVITAIGFLSGPPHCTLTPARGGMEARSCPP